MLWTVAAALQSKTRLPLVSRCCASIELCSPGGYDELGKFEFAVACSLPAVGNCYQVHSIDARGTEIFLQQLHEPLRHYLASIINVHARVECKFQRSTAASPVQGIYLSGVIPSQ